MENVGEIKWPEIRDRGEQMTGHQCNERLLYRSHHLCVVEQILEFCVMSYPECPMLCTGLAFSELYMVQ